MSNTGKKEFERMRAAFESRYQPDSITRDKYGNYEHVQQEWMGWRDCWRYIKENGTNE